ncbi:pilus assembly PilX N-terminal domain-containing protein [Candidatus Shapirobacteria bacterium]|nr:pilus assembly PilX N-terminal domain-containing protein [Candidatus Shapirobacteria bacterium]
MRTNFQFSIFNFQSIFKFNNLKNIKKLQDGGELGQVALIVLLVSAVVMTIGFSVSKKTVVDTKIDSDEEQLKQAFNAAESGIEYYLGTGSTKYTASDNSNSADLSVRNIGNGSTINFDQYSLSGSDIQYWLVAHNVDGSINYGSYYMGSSLSFCMPTSFNGAVKIDYLYRTGASNYWIRRYGYNLGANTVNGFTDLSPLPAQGNCQSNYREMALTTPLGGSNVPILLSIKPIGDGGRFYLLGSGSNFPIQGVNIASTGRVASGVSRQVSVVQTYHLPGFLLDAVTTYGNVTSN